ncbi:MAG: carboxypeptidase regulatory-like domain-containing protein [Nitrospira sp.]
MNTAGSFRSETIENDVRIEQGQGRWPKNVLFAVVTALTLSPGWTPAWSYEEVSVTRGGAIAGRVTLKGAIPPAKAFNLVTFPDAVYCGRISTGTGWRLLKDVVPGPRGGLRDVIVVLRNVPRGKPFRFVPPTLEARDCRFLPVVTVVRDQHPITVVNMDPVMHDIQAYQTSDHGARVLFNVPLPMNPFHARAGVLQSHEHQPGKPVVETIQLTRGRNIVFMQCGFHAYMQSWSLAVDSPYYAITADDGSFMLSEIPEGEYTLMAWHEGVGQLEQSVRVLAGQDIAVNFEFTSIPRRNDLVDNPHFGLEVNGELLPIQPSLERQEP